MTQIELVCWQFVYCSVCFITETVANDLMPSLCVCVRACVPAFVHACVCVHVYEHVQCSIYSFVVHFQFRIAVSLLAVFD